ncbi:hypothetical protein PG985_005812 [Apiospora marii]|uniref:uncharacterized protein n=1 Tax=Apiospora marii TaxID=335849 RepID=UPI0031326616
MSSFSLANRTKVVPSSYLEDSLSSSHEASGEHVYTSQNGLAFHTAPDVTDAYHFALFPEPIREEEGKEEPKTHPPQPDRQSWGSANSSRDLANPPPLQARKKKYTRAFSHRARTGCMTWPTCRRCAAANVVCDGYPSAQPTTAKEQQERGGSAHSQAVVAKSSSSTVASSTTSSTRSDPSPRTTPLFSINPIVFESATEARYFHHFRVCTRFGLGESAGLHDYWDAYALPIAHQEDYL